MGDAAEKVSLCLIARDEATILPALLESVVGAFDDVVLVDTGSVDDTVGVFCRWAARESEAAEATGRRFTWTLDHASWRGDFAAARTRADQLARGDWLVWADADDVVVGARHLRAYAAMATPDTTGYVFPYEYERDDTGRVLQVIHRVRLVRRGRGRWVGRVHETQTVDGAVYDDRSGRVTWQHQRPMDRDRPNAERNRRMLRKWLAAEPQCPTAAAQLAIEELETKDHAAAAHWARRYLRSTSGDADARLYLHRILARALLALDRYDEAERVATDCLRLRPDRADALLTLAECALARGDLEAAADLARQVLEGGPAADAMYVDARDYDDRPRQVLQAAERGSGGPT